ncbi:MAG: AmmeMemoRadiSam system radical SAM enzyme [Clostridia bacterium]|nr:AmmeMemoRadiSam system radical SAM enzyme [Clostridia bacterium]
MQKAMFYIKEENRVRCLLCPHRCLLGEGQVGSCGVRQVEEGELFTCNYGCLAAAHWDPVEKKPLYHYYPGRSILSLGTFGCNLHCTFCQNWSLARGKSDQCVDLVNPAAVLAMLESEGGPDEVLGVAYTYNEPLIWYEFVYDTARLLHEHGYKNVLVTNGYINREPLEELLPYIDAMNIDVKGFSDFFYRQYCRGNKEPVLRTVETAVQACHVEITCLLIPTLNDSTAEQEELASWLGARSPELVLHYSRYFPHYKLDLPPTPVKVMEQARVIAQKHLHYVFLGNLELPGSADTICPNCGNLLITRSGYRIRLVGLDGVHCNRCHNRISIIQPDL